MEFVSINMNQSEASTFIYEQFEQACFSLFEGLSCDVSFGDASSQELENAAIASIDAGSAEMELRVFLRMPFSVLALTYPGSDVTDIEEEKLEDWMAELSNMLVGKIKAAMLHHGLQMTIGLPESFFGVEMEEVTPEGFNDSKAYYFEVDKVPVECRIFLDLMVDSLDVQVVEDDDDVNEGELELF